MIVVARGLLGLMLIVSAVLTLAASSNADPPRGMRVARFADGGLDLDDGTSRVTLKTGQRHGDWTLMLIASGEKPYAVFEDFAHRDGHIRFVDTAGVRLDLAQTLESSQPDAHVFLGHTAAQILASPTDMLARELLAKGGDPEYDEVASALLVFQRRVRDLTRSIRASLRKHPFRDGEHEIGAIMRL